MIETLLDFNTHRLFRQLISANFNLMQNIGSSRFEQQMEINEGNKKNQQFAS